MKAKVTKKAVKENYRNIIGVGYCDLQTLLKYENAFGYSAGAIGWACDYYEVNGICISTGYQPIKTIVADYNMVREYEQKAREIDSNYNITWEERKEQIQPLLRQFVNECIK